jgi:hypothetical protein
MYLLVYSMCVILEKSAMTCRLIPTWEVITIQLREDISSQHRVQDDKRGYTNATRKTSGRFGNRVVYSKAEEGLMRNTFGSHEIRTFIL